LDDNFVSTINIIIYLHEYIIVVILYPLSQICAKFISYWMNECFILWDICKFGKYSVVFFFNHNSTYIVKTIFTIKIKNKLQVFIFYPFFGVKIIYLTLDHELLTEKKWTTIWHFYFLFLYIKLFKNIFKKNIYIYITII
jgi:hypothetical protein